MIYQYFPLFSNYLALTSEKIHPSILLLPKVPRFRHKRDQFVPLCAVATPERHSLRKKEAKYRDEGDGHLGQWDRIARVPGGGCKQGMPVPPRIDNVGGFRAIVPLLSPLRGPRIELEILTCRGVVPPYAIFIPWFGGGGLRFHSPSANERYPRGVTESPRQHDASGGTRRLVHTPDRDLNRPKL